MMSDEETSTQYQQYTTKDALNGIRTSQFLPGLKSCIDKLKDTGRKIVNNHIQYVLESPLGEPLGKGASGIVYPIGRTGSKCMKTLDSKYADALEKWEAFIAEYNLWKELQDELENRRDTLTRCSHAGTIFKTGVSYVSIIYVGIQ